MSAQAALCLLPGIRVEHVDAGRSVSQLQQQQQHQKVKHFGTKATSVEENWQTHTIHTHSPNLRLSIEERDEHEQNLSDNCTVCRRKYVQ